jgi:GT2 family glycosyltransferase
VTVRGPVAQVVGTTGAPGSAGAAGLPGADGGRAGTGPGSAAPPVPRTVAAVLATVGRHERMKPFVEAVLRDEGVLELVVVVDGPDPATVLILEALAASRPRLRVLPVTKRGQLACLDAGVQASWADVVVLLDDDVLPSPGMVSAHLRHHQEAPGLVVVGDFPVELPEGWHPSRGTRLYAAQYEKYRESVLRGEVRVLDELWTGNVSLRRSDCFAVGLANPTFPGDLYHADQDLGFRLSAAGLVGRFDPSLHAAHLHRRSDKEFLRDAGRQGAGRVALHRNHPDRLEPFQLRQVVESLPHPLRVVVAVCGSMPAGPAVARALMRVAAPWERFASATKRGEPLAPAKLAWRIMHWRGARRAMANATGRRGTPGAGGRPATAPR